MLATHLHHPHARRGALDAGCTKRTAASGWNANSILLVLNPLFEDPHLQCDHTSGMGRRYDVTSIHPKVEGFAPSWSMNAILEQDTRTDLHAVGTSRGNRDPVVACGNREKYGTVVSATQRFRAAYRVASKGYRANDNKLQSIRDWRQLSQVHRLAQFRLKERAGGVERSGNRSNGVPVQVAISENIGQFTRFD